MMTVSERYANISKKTGLSEEIIRSVLVATRDSLVESLKNEDRATIPGICTFTAEFRNSMVQDKETGVMVPSKCVKIKAKPTSSFEGLINTSENIDVMIEAQEKEFKDSALRGMKYIDTNVVRTKQIGALI